MDPPRLGRGTLCPGSACREPVCACGDAVETSAGPPGDGRAPHPGARSGGAGTHLGLRGVARLLLEGRALGQRGAVVLVAEVLVGVVQPAGARPGRGPGDGTPVSPASWPAPGLVHGLWHCFGAVRTVPRPPATPGDARRGLRSPKTGGLPLRPASSLCLETSLNHP